MLVSGVGRENGVCRGDAGGLIAGWGRGSGNGMERVGREHR